jgi:hypothetical protein
MKNEFSHARKNEQSPMRATSCEGEYYVINYNFLPVKFVRANVQLTELIRKKSVNFEKMFGGVGCFLLAAATLAFGNAKPSCHGSKSLCWGGRY